ncbi:MAG: Uma2 family endonuclease [Chloroflexota bacterium]|nr:Uma2 family endonuclease [Chloroflexota bacterium]
MLEISNPLTYEEFLRVRDATNDQTELIEGELFVTPSPSSLHQAVVLRLTRVFDRALEERGNGVVFFAPLDVRLGLDSVVQPDILILLDERLNVLGEDAVEGVPSIAIEVLSRSTSRRDLIIKRQLYAAHEVAEYWIADPAGKTVTVHTDPADGQFRSVVTSLDTASSVLLPNVCFELSELFGPISPRMK